MRSLCLALALVVGAAMAYAQRSPPAPSLSPLLSITQKSYALVIGIDRYTNGWRPLQKAVADARAVADTLKAQGFDVRLETDLKAEDLRAVIEEFFLTAGSDPNARLVFWFAGHGHTTEHAYTSKLTGYIVGADAANPVIADDAQRAAAEIEFRRRSVAIEDITARMRRADARHILLVFDSCFSGTAFSGTRSADVPAAVETFATHPARQLITSGTKGQLVGDDGKFRELFVSALKGQFQRADANGDGYITGSELGGFLTDRVINATNRRQTPVYGALRDDYDTGDFIFILPWKAEQLARGDAAKAIEAAQGPSEEQRQFWSFVREQADPGLVERYLAYFPKTPFRTVALDEVKRLRGGGAQVSSGPATSAGSPTKGTPKSGTAPPVVASGQPGTAEALTPPADPRWAEVPVFFGTNRNQVPPGGGGSIAAFGPDRASELALGSAVVTIPRLHAVGAIERPFRLRLPYVGAFDVYRQDDDPQQHFTLRTAKVLKVADLVGAARNVATKSASKAAFVYVHGYNMSFEDALYRTAQLAYDMRFDGPVYLFSWPSAASVSAYLRDRDSAEASRPYLKEFLKIVGRETGAGTIHVLAHAQGSGLALGALRDLADATDRNFAIGQVMFAAPDVDAEGFNFACRDLKPHAAGMTVYASSSDRALDVAARVTQGPRAGQIAVSGPVIGLDCANVIDVSANTSSVGLNHSGFAGDNSVLSDLGLLLKGTTDTPDRRSASFTRVETPSGAYWKTRE